MYLFTVVVLKPLRLTKGEAQSYRVGKHGEDNKGSKRCCNRVTVNASHGWFYRNKAELRPAMRRTEKE